MPDHYKFVEITSPYESTLAIVVGYNSDGEAIKLVRGGPPVKLTKEEFESIDQTRFIVKKVTAEEVEQSEKAGSEPAVNPGAVSIDFGNLPTNEEAAAPSNKKGDA